VFLEELKPNRLPDDTAHVRGFGGEDASVLEPDVMSLVVAVPRHGLTCADDQDRYVDNPP
jgi:hypothetical protein